MFKDFPSIASVSPAVRGCWWLWLFEETYNEKKKLRSMWITCVRLWHHNRIGPNTSAFIACAALSSSPPFGRSELSVFLQFFIVHFVHHKCVYLHLWDIFMWFQFFHVCRVEKLLCSHHHLSLRSVRKWYIVYTREWGRRIKKRKCAELSTACNRK